MKPPWCSPLFLGPPTQAQGKEEPKSRPYSRWVRKCETEIEDDDSDVDGPGDAAPAAAAPPPAPEGPAPLKYQFYQSAEVVTMTVMEKGLSPGEVRHPRQGHRPSTSFFALAPTPNGFLLMCSSCPGGGRV